MKIQNNITAANAHRQYTVNNENTAKAAEKLSSGYRINSAGDDAAGLAISEKMRAQIRGLDTASKNSQDAISLIQTAEGALSETHSMLQRMNELAVQSSTGTGEDFDRAASNAEFEQLKLEINDIASQTTFNNMNLLDGSLGTGKMLVDTADATGTTIKAGVTLNGTVGTLITSHTGVTAGTAGTFTLTQGSGVDADKLNIVFAPSAGGTSTTTSVKFSDVYQSGGGTGDSFSIDLSAAGLGSVKGVLTANVTESTMLASFTGSNDTITVKPWYTENRNTTSGVTGLAANTVSFAGVTATGDFSFTASGTNLIIKDSSGATLKSVSPADLAANGVGTIDLTDIGLGTLSFTGSTGDPTVANEVTDIASIGTLHAGNATNGGALQVQVGALEGEQLSVQIQQMNSGALGVQGLSISDQPSAGTAITATREAINTVSTQRALLGATSNRLGHRIANLNVSSENAQAAESRIRDVDMAKEMTNFTKQGILASAATAMLAQANAAPQNVLQLLRG